MINGEITTKIVFDEEGRQKLWNTVEVLYEVDNAFNKAGTISEDDSDRQHIRGAIGVIESILSGETF